MKSIDTRYERIMQVIKDLHNEKEELNIEKFYNTFQSFDNFDSIVKNRFEEYRNDQKATINKYYDIISLSLIKTMMPEPIGAERKKNMKKLLTK